MTQTQLNKFRQVLEAKAADLAQSTRNREGIRVERTADALDGILGARERELAVQTLSAETSRLRDIRAALERIHDGCYGECAECEETISPARLNALPWAALCIHCQEAAQDGFGGNRVRYQFAMAA